MQVTIAMLPPVEKREGDQWIDEQYGRRYTWVVQPFSSQWVEF
jgi:hypothetical protein